ncbi:pyrokinin-1 receptor-like isoform X1 [Saccostrea echinata]|uniref:pyrokinin-1 receptor-like isoform X1 n=1 Tax=Saccostrea echinata TaxID=191078 RepID=UPI002A81F713|nr:pyrokinin-1 receptor-like isoform X1 [Saccostrea echinata]
MTYLNSSIPGLKDYLTTHPEFQNFSFNEKNFNVHRKENESNLSDSNFISEEFIKLYLGERQINYITVCLLTFIYVTIFLTGLIGNIFTVLVILKNVYMRSVTNYYLLSLASADLLTIIIALPPEVYTIWEAYPWRFGEPFCIFKAFLLEWTSYASVLTITGFTVERYIAICHPITGQKVTRQSRAFKCIICIWIISACCALPYPFHTRTFYYLNDPRTNLPINDTLLCNIPIKWHERMIVMFQVSTFAFFFLPMCIITIMYILIGIRLRRTEVDTTMGVQYKGALSTTARARKAVLKMLVAVVVAFFLCWAPFHAQRLMTLYVKDWSPESMEFHSHLFYISGVLYFVSSTVNPILYNLLSRKFRYAFKRTFCRCCLNLEPFPTFYKLKAIFINRSEQNSGSPSPRFIYPQKPVGLDTPYNKHGGSLSMSRPVKQASTKDTVVKCSSSGSSSHAHSDGRLHFICRHKSCSSNRIRLSLEINMMYTQFNNASCQDIEKLRKMKCFKQLSNQKVDSKDGETEKDCDVTASLI